MGAVLVDKDDQYVLNHCTRFLARDSTDSRHNSASTSRTTRGRWCVRRGDSRSWTPTTTVYPWSRPTPTTT